MTFLLPWPRSRPFCAYAWTGLRRLKKPGRRAALAQKIFLLTALACLAWSLLPLAFKIPPSLYSSPERSPLILDRHGRVLDEAPRDDLFRHSPVTFKEIPIALLDATLVAEDKRFFSHDGMDLRATIRATRDCLRHRRVVSGASTITQQLIKISSPPTRRNISSKIRESLTARHLEYQWSKERILTAYLNRLDYGNHRQGCRCAARFYFGKPLTDLSLAECALLAGLPQSPSLHNPVRNPESALKRRDWILDRLAKVRNYDPDQVAAAKKEPLTLSATSFKKRAPHLTATLRQDQSLAGKIDQTVMTTSIDRSLQTRVDAIVREELIGLQESNVHHAAVVVIENDTGEILALIGSGDFSNPRGGQINGTRSPRSAGSTLKPFTYLLAFERLGLSTGSIIADIPTPYRTEEGLDLPVNYDHKHYGPVTIRHALANSLNVSAMRTLNRIGGPTPLANLLRKNGITTLRDSAAGYGLGLTIGNAEVTLLELTNAYASLARLGRFKPYTFLLKPDPSGSAGSHPEIANRQASYLVADILSDNTARSPTFGSRSSLRLPFKAAVKTGTSSDFRDNWCIGFTRDLTVGVWVGNFDNTPMRGVSGVSGAGPIFHRTMLTLHADREPRWLQRPSGIVDVVIDSRTGHRFPQDPPAGQPFATRELTINRRLPDPVHSNDYDERGRALVDQRYQEWFASPDNHRHDDLALSSERPPDLSPRIISPMPTATYLLDPELPSGGRLLRLLSNLPGSPEWSSPTLQIEGQTAHLMPGQHEITLLDPATGRRVSQKILVQSL